MRVLLNLLNFSAAAGAEVDSKDSTQQGACLQGDFPDYFESTQNKFKINMSAMTSCFNPGHSSCTVSHCHSHTWRKALDSVSDFACELHSVLPLNLRCGYFWVSVHNFWQRADQRRGGAETDVHAGLQLGSADRGKNIVCTSLDVQTHESGDSATVVILRHSQPSRFDEFQQQLMNLSSGSCCLKVAWWLLAALAWSWSGRTVLTWTLLSLSTCYSVLESSVWVWIYVGHYWKTFGKSVE